MDHRQHLVDWAAEIRRGAVRLALRFRGEQHSGGLSTNKLGVLGHLYRHGPTTPGDLAAVERQHPQSLTRVFAELEQLGLITRARSDHDRRQSVLEITPAGREAMERDVAGRDAWLVSALSTLSDTEVQVLRLASSLMERLAGTALPSGEEHRDRAAPAKPRHDDGSASGSGVGVGESR